MTDAKRIVVNAFEAWRDGTGYITDIFDEAMTWEIVGESAAAGTYGSRQEFIDEVLHPFGRRFGADRPFRPVAIRTVVAEEDTVVVLWDGEGTTIADSAYRNTYAWSMRLRDGKVIDGVAFFDSIAFDRLWNEVAPAG